MKKIIISTIALSLTAPLAFAGSSEKMEGKSHHKDSSTDHATYGSSMDAEVKAVTDRDLETAKTADDLIDAKVVDRSNQSIGKITDLACEKEGVSQAFIQVGGILGMGGETVSVPFDALTETQHDGETVFRLDVEADQFTSSVEEDRGTISFAEGKQAEVVSSDEMETRETVKDALGKEVVDSSGESVGTIEDLALENDELRGAILKLEIDTEAETDLVEVPFESLQSVEEDGERHYRIDISSDQLAASLSEATAEGRKVATAG